MSEQPTPGSEALPLTAEELVLMRHPDRATLPIELRLLATIDADRTKIARLSKIEERAKEVLREREDSTAAYILEGGTRHVGKPDARKGAAMDRAAQVCETFRQPSPTIAAVTEEMMERAFAAYPNGADWHRDGLRAALEAALATPSPTIAAPSPSQSNTLDLPPCPVCGETLVTRYSGPLPGCPQGISTAVCPTNPSHASQPPQASPSDEVTPEKIRVRLFQEVGGWSVTCNGHADEHVCLAASTLFNAVCAGLTTLATVYPDQIEIIEATDEPSPSHDCADKGHKGDCPHFYLYPD